MNSHILVVEDDVKACNKLAYRLQYAGYQVTQAYDGESAVKIIQSEEFDVVLTDIVMGNVDGIQVLHTARRQKNRPSVILLTGYGSLNTCIEALRTGAYDYLLKPCSPEQLISCVQGAVKRYSAEQKLRDVANILVGHVSEQISAVTPMVPQVGGLGVWNMIPLQQTIFPVKLGELSIGNSRHDVTLESEQVHLTPIEYTLLRYLAERVNHICRLRDIVKYTHGFDTSDGDAYNLLKTHIRNLRKKITPKYIINERGRGYRLTNPN
jgi:DNA-binding response OmpR family regulator